MIPNRRLLRRSCSHSELTPCDRDLYVICCRCLHVIHVAIIDRLRAAA